MKRTVLFFLFTVITGSGLFASTDRPIRLEIPPGGWKMLGEKEPSLPPVVMRAVERVPRWLREDFYWKMRDLSMVELKLNGQTGATLLDVNGDGLQDLAVGTSDGLVKFFLNKGSRFHPVFSGVETYVPPEIDVVDRAVPFAADVDGDGDLDLVVGNSRGQVFLYENQGIKGKFVRFGERQDYFTVKAPPEKKKDGKEKKVIIDVGQNSCPLLYDWDGDGDLDLVVGTGDGRVRFFVNEGNPEKPLWKEATEKSPFREIKVSGNASPAVFVSDFRGKSLLTLLVFDGKGKARGYFYREGRWVPSPEAGARIRPWPPERGSVIPSVVDVNGDGHRDALLGTSSGRVHLVEDIALKNGPGETSGGSDLVAGSQWLGGYDLIRGGTRSLTFVKVFNPFYALKYSGLLLDAEKKLVDEVGFSIAHTATAVLRAMVDAPPDKDGITYTTRVLEENARWIYRLSRLLPYARLVEKGDHTTLSLLLSDGKWHELPPEIYYWYVVHPRLRFEAPVRYLGNFWREFFLRDRKYGSSAVEAVKGARSVRQAMEKLSLWSRNFVEWGEESHDKLPREPYYANYGSCGEWSIFGVALGRSLLIPMRLANDWGEDHVWNEFYEVGGWHRWDLNFPPETSMDRPEIYETQWKKSVSTVWTIRGDDRPLPIPGKYTGLARVNITVSDPRGNPVAGAMVIVLSFWAVEKKYDKVPLLSTWALTDEEGRTVFQLGENRYKLMVASREGLIKEVFLEDSRGMDGHILEGKDYSLKITLSSPGRERAYGTPRISSGPSRGRKWRAEHLSSFQKARVPLNYPAKYHYITGNEYTVPSRGKLFYFVCPEAQIKNFLGGRPFKVLSRGPFRGEVSVPRNYRLILWNRSRASWFRVTLR